MAGHATLLAGIVLLTLAPSLPASEPGSAGAPIRGVRGEPVARAVVRWSDMALEGSGAVAPARRRKRPGPASKPYDLPVPEGALVRMETRPEAAAPRSGTPPSPAPASSFEALPDDPETQLPDTHGAVGLNHLMVTLNSQVRIQDRSGNVLSTVTLSEFWARVGGGSPSDVFDPRVLYDPYDNRWITTAVGNFYGSLLVGVSQTGDPTGSWNLYSIHVPPWLVDYPTVGFNKDWIVVTSAFTTEFPAMTTRHCIFEKANLYAGGSGSFTSITGRGEDIGAGPAITLDPEAALYLLRINLDSDGNVLLRFFTITGSVGSEVLTPGTFLHTTDPWLGSGGCPQMGDPRTISCFSGSDVVFRNGTIWWANIIFLPADAPTRNAIQWWQLAPDGGVVQRGLFGDASGVRFYGFPSLAVNRNGDMLLGFTSFAEQQFASASYAYRGADDPPGTLRAERVLKAGEDSYFKTDGHGGNRWGDYSATVVDPINDIDLWTIQEYAATKDPVSGTGRWGTWWGRVVPEAAPETTRMPPQPPARPRTPGELPPRGP